MRVPITSEIMLRIKHCRRFTPVQNRLLLYLNCLVDMSYFALMTALRKLSLDGVFSGRKCGA